MSDSKARLDVLRTGIKTMFLELSACIEAGEKSENPFLKSKAREIGSAQSYLLGVFRDAGGPERISDRLADGIIADWAKSYALFHMPEMIGMDDPEIAADVEAILTKAEAELVEFHDETMDCVSAESLQMYQAFAPGEEVTFARLLSAEDVLQKSLAMIRSGIEPVSPAPQHPYG